MSNTHNCDAIALLCMDWRLYESGQLFQQIKELTGVTSFDLLSLAGGSQNCVELPMQPAVFKHIDLCKKLHNGKKIILTNHTDCGAYGEEGNNREKLIADLHEAKRIISDMFQYKDMEVVMVFITLQETKNGWKTSCEVIE